MSGSLSSSVDILWCLVSLSCPHFSLLSVPFLSVEVITIKCTEVKNNTKRIPEDSQNSKKVPEHPLEDAVQTFTGRKVSEAWYPNLFLHITHYTVHEACLDRIESSPPIMNA